MVERDWNSGPFQENWTGRCRECGWEYTDMGSIGVSAEARVHLHEADEKHVVDVYRDDDLMETIETMHDTGDEYPGEDTPTLKEREEEQERIAREIADPE